ncbi:MAG: type I-E CRISPR-associated protein Cas7/Cse4/CasC [Candidatus Marinimicrobia bacterium]|nr:type I-E CRISPR-associated protein Cas7/Cse4/CasC [Candidatus Neomarinimicrobiota bacterium]
MSKNFINFHILISHSPSCLNRDDMNMQKSAIFGGIRRVRISSQSLKRAMWKSNYYTDNIGKPSIRTRELGKLQPVYIKALEDRYTESQIIQALEWISGKEGLVALSTKSVAVAPWVVEEVAYFCDLIASVGEDADPKKLAKQISIDARPLRIALANAVDIALSGRMATSGLMSNIDGAMAIAHSITTHAVDADIDWFTAVDDLVEMEMEQRVGGESVQGKGEQGAGHLDTQEFSSGVFYRYASLNLKQLQVNLGLLADMKYEETAESRKAALAIAKHVLHMMATVVPAAKQQSHAAYNPADFALVTFSDIPISLANAFEEPVKAKNGFLITSIDKLKNYWETVHKGYDLNESAAQFQLGQIESTEEPHCFASLIELEEWIETNAGQD